mmetsp:Transcript_6711/g.12334  ORF Transcript_6711/g.12334 Transcript_6711/m.12334 type:complete len:719 (-) Transcript_6711:441-2597(-)
MTLVELLFVGRHHDLDRLDVLPLLHVRRAEVFLCLGEVVEDEQAAVAGHVRLEEVAGDADVDGRRHVVAGQHPDFDLSVQQVLDRLGHAVLQLVLDGRRADEVHLRVAFDLGLDLFEFLLGVVPLRVQRLLVLLGPAPLAGLGVAEPPLPRLRSGRDDQRPQRLAAEALELVECVVDVLLHLVHLRGRHLGAPKQRLDVRVGALAVDFQLAFVRAEAWRDDDGHALALGGEVDEAHVFEVFEPLLAFGVRPLQHHLPFGAEVHFKAHVLGEVHQGLLVGRAGVQLQRHLGVGVLHVVCGHVEQLGVVASSPAAAGILVLELFLGLGHLGEHGVVERQRVQVLRHQRPVLLAAGSLHVALHPILLVEFHKGVDLGALAVFLELSQLRQDVQPLEPRLVHDARRRRLRAVLLLPHYALLEVHAVLRQRSRLVGENVMHLSQLLVQPRGLDRRERPVALLVFVGHLGVPVHELGLAELHHFQRHVQRDREKVPADDKVGEEPLEASHGRRVLEVQVPGVAPRAVVVALEARVVRRGGHRCEDAADDLQDAHGEEPVVHLHEDGRELGFEVVLVLGVVLPDFRVLSGVDGETDDPGRVAHDAGPEDEVVNVHVVLLVAAADLHLALPFVHHGEVRVFGAVTLEVHIHNFELLLSAFGLWKFVDDESWNRFRFEVSLSVKVLGVHKHDVSSFCAGTHHEYVAWHSSVFRYQNKVSGPYLLGLQ